MANHLLWVLCSNSTNSKPIPPKSTAPIDDRDVPPLINTDRTKYAIGQVVHVFGQAFDTNGNHHNGTLKIEVNKTHTPYNIWCYKALENQTISKSVVIPIPIENKGNYTYNFMNEESGKYIITASKNGSEVKGWTQIETVSVLYSLFNGWLLTAGAFFLGLLLLLSLTSYNYHKCKDKFDDKKECAKPIDKNSSRKLVDHDLSSKYHLSCQGISDQNSENKKEQSQSQEKKMNLEIPEIVRFICISGIVFSVIAAFIFTDVEIGTNSPIGLVIRHDLNPHAENDFDRNGNLVNEWIINIGGNWSNNFSSGIVIPVYVVIFGILGGYLRYLYKAASKEEEHQVGEGEEFKTLNETNSKDFIHITLAEFAQVVLSALLAIVVWFILSQGDNADNIFLLAAVSFSVGLITRDIIRAIIKFILKIIPPAK